VVSPHGLKPCAAPQSPFVSPADVCPLRRGLHRVPVCGSDRQLRGDEIWSADVGSGSPPAGRLGDAGDGFQSETVGQRCDLVGPSAERGRHKDRPSAQNQRRAATLVQREKHPLTRVTCPLPSQQPTFRKTRRRVTADDDVIQHPDIDDG